MMLLNKKLQFSQLKKCHNQTTAAYSAKALVFAASVKQFSGLLTTALKLLGQQSGVATRSQTRYFNLFTRFPAKPKFAHNRNSTIDFRALAQHVNSKFTFVRNQIYDRYCLFIRTHLTLLFRHVQFRAKFVTNERTPKLASLGTRASLTASVGLFAWDDQRITDDEVKKEVSDILTLFGVENEKQSAEQTPTSKKIDFEATRCIETDEWKKIYNEKDLIIWRRAVPMNDELMNDPDSSSYDLFEYKVLGRINDITPLDYFQTQIDLGYRKVWDHLVISLRTIETEESTRSELIRWVSHFPYPLYPREYIYVRRFCLEPNERLLILVARSVTDAQLKLEPPADKAASKRETTFVRVNNYKSNIIVIPHTDYDKVGLDYIIQYYDINKAKIPRIAFKYMTTSGLPDFMSEFSLILYSGGHLTFF
jgi:hypothetical protein